MQQRSLRQRSSVTTESRPFSCCRHTHSHTLNSHTPRLNSFWPRTDPCRLAGYAVAAVYYFFLFRAPSLAWLAPATRSPPWFPQPPRRRQLPAECPPPMPMPTHAPPSVFPHPLVSLRSHHPSLPPFYLTIPPSHIFPHYSPSSSPADSISPYRILPNKQRTLPFSQTTSNSLPHPRF